jgi:2-hydroxychromene-2-carboxylate isomerase/predicted thioesterase
MKPVQSGISTTFEIVPGAGDTASAVGNAGIDVVATTALILFIEKASDDLVTPYYEPGEATVGTRIEVDHRAPARPGAPLRVTARLEQIRGRRLMFANEVRQDATVVMKGFHHRSLVRMRDFSAAPAGPEREPAVIDFWFDFHSPWCYLATTRIGAIARGSGAALRWRPVHLANLIDAIGGRRPLEENPAFVSWYRQDILDQAAELRLPYRPHPNYPLRPSRALRAALLAGERGRAGEFVPTVMRAYWVDGKDISDLGVLGELGATCGLGAESVREAATDEVYKQRLAANLSEAIARGVFGVPTAILDGKRFFGNDHLDLLGKFLARRG